MTFSISIFDLLLNYGVTSFSNNHATVTVGSDSASGSSNINPFCGNLGVSGLYSFLDSSVFIPVIGGEINLLSAEYVGVNLLNQSILHRLTRIATIANAGLKVAPAKYFKMYGLASFGYSPIMLYMVSSGFKFKATNELAIFALGNIGYSPVLFSRNSKTSKNSDFYFKNYSYGASLIGTYNVMPEISVGAGATYNFNYLRNEANTRERFNELSANVYVAYSL